MERLDDPFRELGGDVVDDGITHPFRWDPATGAIADIGTLGGDLASAADINAAGVAVGYSADALGSRNNVPVRWDPPAPPAG